MDTHVPVPAAQSLNRCMARSVDQGARVVVEKLV